MSGVSGQAIWLLSVTHVTVETAMRSACEVEFAEGSDAGRVRPGNEDAVFIDPTMGLVVVADGLGSYNAGEVASRTAVEAVQEFVTHGTQSTARRLRVKPGGSTHDSVLLRDALVHANEVIYDQAKRQPLYDGMGATVLAALFYGGRVAIAHAGDVRAYRLRHGRFDQLTHDHTHQRETVRPGFGAPEPAGRGQVTRALGVEPAVMVDLLDSPLASGDLYLFCTDGLHDMVPDEDIRLTLDIFGDNLETVAKQLIKLANDNGGRDNVSVVVAKPGVAFGHSRRSLRGRVRGWFS